MKLTLLVLILIVGFGLLGLTMDVASGVRKGAKDAGKAGEATGKDAARGTKSAAKDVADAADKTTKTCLRTPKTSQERRQAQVSGLETTTGKDIGKRAEDAGKDRRKRRTR